MLMFDYIWKSIAVGACAALSDLMNKRFEDLKYMMKFLVGWMPEVGKCPDTELSFTKLHLTNVFRFWLDNKPGEEELEKMLQEQAQIAIEWVIFRQVLKEAATKGSTKSLPTDLPKLTDASNSDALSIMTELIILKALVLNWNKEKINNFVNITESEDISAKLSAFQKLLCPKLLSSIMLSSAEKVQKTKELVGGDGKMVSCETLASNISKLSQDIYLGPIIGSTKGKLSLFQALPEGFPEFQQTFFSKNCSLCGTHMMEKYLCLLCGSILCNNCKFCKNEIREHSELCNGGVGLYMHIFYGFIIILRNFFSNPVMESLYKTPNQRDVCAFTIVARSMGSRDLEEYKLSKEACQKWNTLYVTDRLHIESQKAHIDY